MVVRRSRKKADQLDQYLKFVERSRPWLILGALPEQVAEAVTQYLDERKPGLKEWQPNVEELANVRDRLRRKGPPKGSTRDMIRRSATRTAAKTAKLIKRARDRQVHEEVSRRFGSRQGPVYAVVVQPNVENRPGAGIRERDNLREEASSDIYSIVDSHAKYPVEIEYGHQNALIGIFDDLKEALVCVREIASKVRRIDESNDQVEVAANYGVSAVSSAQMKYRGLMWAALLGGVRRAFAEAPMSLTVPGHFNFEKGEVEKIFGKTPYAEVSDVEGGGISIKFELAAWQRDRAGVDKAAVV